MVFGPKRSTVVGISRTHIPGSKMSHSRQCSVAVVKVTAPSGFRLDSVVVEQELRSSWLGLDHNL